MDMILVKKKRIALAEANNVGGRQYAGSSDQSNLTNRGGFWKNILSSVGSITNTLGHGSESEYPFIYFLFFYDGNNRMLVLPISSKNVRVVLISN